MLLNITLSCSWASMWKAERIINTDANCYCCNKCLLVDQTIYNLQSYTKSKSTKKRTLSTIYHRVCITEFVYNMAIWDGDTKMTRLRLNGAGRVSTSTCKFDSRRQTEVTSKLGWTAVQSLPLRRRRNSPTK